MAQLKCPHCSSTFYAPSYEPIPNATPLPEPTTPNPALPAQARAALKKAPTQ